MDNKVKQNLLEECLAYIIYGQEIHPTHVEDMIKESFEAGYEEAINNYYETSLETSKNDS